MPKFSDLNPGSALWVDHFGKHPAVALVCDDSSALVACGTSREWKDEPEAVTVRLKSAAGYVLGLNRPTYFYPKGIAMITDVTKIVSVAKQRCPPGTFHKLEELARIAGELCAATLEENKTPSRR